ncbi:hypothetical protein ABC345_00925 [Shouchella sp. 1P09AA]|uniref:hypothetical protein n=1 Tax=unclassified Shouchella TaxID=2893065 RepID=UPI0039A1A69A
MNKTRNLLVMGLVAATLIIAIAFLLISKIYFNSKEIQTASQQCVDNDGLVQVEKSFLSLTYSFSCSIE